MIYFLLALSLGTATWMGVDAAQNFSQGEVGWGAVFTILCVVNLGIFFRNYFSEMNRGR